MRLVGHLVGNVRRLVECCKICIDVVGGYMGGVHFMLNGKMCSR